MPQGQCPFFLQELISEHFGEDGTSYETEIQELEGLRQVGGLLPIWLLQKRKVGEKVGSRCRGSHGFPTWWEEILEIASVHGRTWGQQLTLFWLCSIALRRSHAWPLLGGPT